MTRKKGVKDPMIIDYDKNDLNDHMRQLEDMKAPPWSYGGDRVGGGTKGVEGVVATTAQAVDSVVNQPPNVAFMV